MPAKRSPTHSGLEQRVLARLRRLDACGGTIVVGFSGGADSLALAAVLVRLSPLTGSSVALVHVDHRLRIESGDDAAQAANLATALGTPFYLQTGPDHPAILFPGVGIEEAARRMRYVALAHVARELSATAVAIAHHREDQAETVLLHLLRGAGLSGASGMSELSTISIPWWEISDTQTTIRLWRPLLNESRETIHTYARGTGLTPIDDPSNDDPRFTRNRIRHDVLPLLRSLNPDASATLSRYARIVGAEDQLLDHIATAAFQQLVTEANDLTVASLLKEPLPIQRRIARTWLHQSGVTTELTLERLEAVIDLARRRRGGARLELGNGWSVAYRHGILSLKNDRADHQTDMTSTISIDPTTEDE